MNYYDIGNRIRLKRKEQDISQEQLAETVEISITHMSHIETGNTKLSLPVLIKIANALHVGTDELLCDNLVSSERVFTGEIADVVEKCDNTQIRVITDVVKAVKQSLDKHQT